MLWVWGEEGIAWIIRRWKESFAALKVNGFRKVVMIILAMQYAICCPGIIIAFDIYLLFY